jgi:hypothetical protein
LSIDNSALRLPATGATLGTDEPLTLNRLAPGACEWPDGAWKAWRYRRATLARLLANTGMMKQVADAYGAVLDKGAPQPSTLWERVEAQFLSMTSIQIDSNRSKKDR